MANRSLGIKRITTAVSVLACMFTAILLLILSDGLKRFAPIDWVISMVALVIAYGIPQLIRLVTYWVVDGFRQDRHS